MDEKAGIPPLRPDASTSVAAIDVGTNNCRLLIAEPAAQGFRITDAFSRIVRLGEGLVQTGMLSEKAIARTLSALDICAAKMHRARVGRIRAVATEACRRATNGLEFLEQVRFRTGIILEPISTDEEARLALAGCSALLDRTIPRAIVFDIGGGSTEVLWVDVPRMGLPRIIDQMSIPEGVVSMAERFGKDHVDSSAYEAMMAVITPTLEAFERRNDIVNSITQGCVQMLGTSGTITTLAGIHQRLPRYDRSRVDGSYLTLQETQAVSHMLRESSLNERVFHPCIGPERADLVIPGCAVLDAICRIWSVPRLRIADRGLREGILVDLLLSGSVVSPV